MNHRFYYAISALLLLALGSVVNGEEASKASGKEAGVREEDVTVYGLFSEIERVTGSAHRIAEDALEAFQYDDINRVLNVIPGVYTREEDGAGLRPNIGLRGGSSDRSQKVIIMEDGVPIGPAPYSAPAAYYFPLVSRMAGLEVYKGPSSIQHGPQTIGGAINFLSAPVPESVLMQAEFAGGSDGYQFAHLRGGNTMGDTGFLAEFIHTGSDGFKDLDSGDDTGFDKNELVVRLKQSVGQGTLEARLGYADEVSDETYLGLTQEDFDTNPYRRYAASELDRMEWDWYGGRVDWRQSFAGGDLRVTGYAHFFDRAWLKFNNFSGADIRELLLNPEGPFNSLFVSVLQGNDSDGVGGSLDDILVGTNDRSFEQRGLQGIGDWSWGDAAVQHSLQLGIRYHFDTITRLHDEFSYEQIDGRLVQNTQPRAITADNTGETDALALWVRDEVTIGDWIFVPGLRVELINNSFDNRLSETDKNENDYTIVLPGLGMRWKMTDALSLVAGVHKGFSPAVPSLEDNLDPEESINYEMGARWNADFGRFNVIAFLNDYSNLTAICTFSSGCTGEQLDSQISAGEAETFGLELGWNHVFESAASVTFPAALTYTYTSAEFEEEFSSPRFGSVQPGDEQPYIPEHRANLSIGVEGASWNLSLSATHTSSMRDQAGSGEILESEGTDEYTVVDLAAYYALSPEFKLTARLDNLLDDTYIVSRRPFGSRPGKPLSFQVGIAYKY